jgi:hypothetical protein
MPLLARFASRWRSLVHPIRVDDDLDEEPRGYLDALVERKMRAGMDPARPGARRSQTSAASIA